MTQSALPAGAAELAAAPVQPAVPANALSDEPGSLQLQLLERIVSAPREDLVGLSCEMFNGKPDFYMAGLLWQRWVEVDPEGLRSSPPSWPANTFPDRRRPQWNTLTAIRMYSEKET